MSRGNAKSEALRGAATQAEKSEGSGVFPTLRSPVIEVAMRATGDGGVAHGGLSMSRYVAVGALLRAFPRPRKGEVLALVGLADKDWERARTCWMAALRAPDDEAVALLERWSTAFDEAWETLQADPPSMDDLESARAKAAAAPEMPTYLRAGEPLGVDKPLQSTMPSLGVPTIVDLPFNGKVDAPPAASMVSPPR